ncbi:MAG: threonine ammonia-lyase [Deltaproteobacteria bacterium]|nr:threonine ammonia-lyase [Deltaproteobacteria bacterium]
MIALTDVQFAHREIRDRIIRTPTLWSEFFSNACGAEVFLKLENLQRTGSFKIRGATYKIGKSAAQIGTSGIVAASAGNHAQGVALAARNYGLAATIVMPENASLSKQLATRGYGGKVVLHGASVAEALRHAQALAEEGGFFIHPFDDEDVMAGQGTVGLEIVEELGTVDEVWVPVGGGGLIAGIAVAVKETLPGARIVGVQAAVCPSALEARRRGAPCSVAASETIADGIAITRVGDRPFPVIEKYVDELVTVDEDGIALAMLHLLERKKLLAEGAGAVCLAALLAAGEKVRGKRVALVVSGGNVDMNLLDRILERGLIRTGRILRFAVVLRDAPGSLASLLTELSSERANILHISHDRLRDDLAVWSTRVEIEMETRSATHGDHILRMLHAKGFSVERSVG